MPANQLSRGPERQRRRIRKAGRKSDVLSRTSASQVTDTVSTVAPAVAYNAGDASMPWGKRRGRGGLRGLRGRTRLLSFI
jgi:hypothetical protein